MPAPNLIREGERLDPDLDVPEQLATAYLIKAVQRETREEFRREVVALMDDHIANYQCQINDLPDNDYGRWAAHQMKRTMSELRCLIMLVEKANYYGEYAQADASETARIHTFSLPASIDPS